LWSGGGLLGFGVEKFESVVASKDCVGEAAVLEEPPRVATEDVKEGEGV
jgi:hypothetical protein